MRALAFGIAAPVPRYSILLAPFCLICRLAQEAPGLAFTAPVASAAPVATLAPATRAMAPAEEEVGPRRGDFTRLEYERRAQLKLMDDLDKVLRPRASGTGGPGRGGRRATRPRSGCCDDSALARSPARGLLGEDPVRRGPMIVEKGSVWWDAVMGQEFQCGEGNFLPRLDSEDPLGCFRMLLNSAPFPVGV